MRLNTAALQSSLSDSTQLISVCYTMRYAQVVITTFMVVIAVATSSSLPLAGVVLEVETVRGEPHCPSACKCSAYFKMVSCTQQHLLDIPKDIPLAVTELYLGDNLLTVIRAGDFHGLSNLTTLSLKQNHIYKIDDGAFDGLDRLKTLYLTGNRIADLTTDVFRGLSALSDLYLTDNLLTAIPILKYSRSLVKLSLDTNVLVSASFAPEFMNTTISTIGLANNPTLARITDEDLQFLPMTVRKINLARCGLVQISRKICRFRHLQSLSMSYMNPRWNLTVLLSVMKSLINCTQLSSLDLSGTIKSPSLPAGVFRTLLPVPLKTLNLAHTEDVDRIDADMFHYFPKLEKLDLSNSDFALVEGNISSMPKLQRLTLAKNKKLATVPKLSLPSLTFLDLSGSTTGLSLVDDMFIQVPSLKTLQLSECGIRTVSPDSFAGLYKLESLDLSNNRIAGSSLPAKLFRNLRELQSLSLKGNNMGQNFLESTLFDGLVSLRILDLSDNGCSVLPNASIFVYLTSLRHLDLSGNMLGVSVIGQTTGSQLFAGLTSVETINLQANKITSFPVDLFHPTVSLQTVNMSGNDLVTWEESAFNVSSNLSVIEFSSNRISIVTQAMIFGLPSSDVRLYLTGNPFTCWCDLIWFRRWIEANPNDTARRLPGLSSYRCNSPVVMSGMPLLQFHPDDIERTCFPPSLIMISTISTVVAVIFIVFIFTIMYRKRWSLRLRIYYVRKRCRRSRHRRRRSTRHGYRRGINENDDVGEYNLLVSYFQEDESGDWVKNTLSPTLEGPETQRGLARGGFDNHSDDVEEDGNNSADIRKRYRIFFEEKDVQPNEMTIGVIDEAMRISNRVMIVASEDYVADSRRQYEVRMAVERGANRIIIVLWRDESVGPKLPQLVHPLLRDALIWTPDNREGKELFWQKLFERLETRLDE